MVVGYLLVLALLALLFLILIFRHYRRSVTQGRPEPLGFIRIVVNWALLLVLVGSLGSAGYLVLKGNHSSSADQKQDKAVSSSSVVSSSSASTPKKLAALGVTYSPEEPTLTGNSVKVKFKVSPQSSLLIQGHYSGKTFKTFKAKSGRSTEHFSYKFKTAGTYDLVAKRDGKTVTKEITIKDNDASSSSSSSVVASSSSSSAVVSSSSTSTVQRSSSSTSTGTTSRTTTGTGTTASRRSTYTGNTGSTQHYHTTSGASDSGASSYNTTNTTLNSSTGTGTGEYGENETAR
ncbi:hypothetical protein FC26_GL001977 [Paucilactobacillus vaccinostercus DSM 20634]|jgi:hypothetical protein|uniref:Uncharacterized protein n=1 Tax=Paucilactobacillus vaccinostercus DSM 20634 TaxID=1423813 RepID=A0A0R2A2K4_9LACO|nr:hypothetical protein [Paucilactobacillus vaccinostercus]KRM61159.1 hypothetical protein FC26_GL001977 [Paucilactobacillus vaccinostercus DSM 20634]